MTGKHLPLYNNRAIHVQKRIGKSEEEPVTKGFLCFFTLFCFLSFFLFVCTETICLGG
ncbi:hypothetical protein HM1_1657 [Heliomicrobium modesticaldum Ice1]|uniref:Uncharacterized protein n=1 Tax=Heliobacterium modesticaldum (strain ATCC 51547 / Ice1) TaxID=498761 RepID=B0TE32_HELMI|nr:hypothetical protein HM1_1657 [Heliomicrobium modesticaldum Ice1]